MIHWLGITTDERRARAEALFPDCYSEQFDRCLKITDLSQAAATGFPGCVELSQLYPPGEHDPVLEAKIQAIPFCPQAKGISVGDAAMISGVILGLALFFRAVL